MTTTTDTTTEGVETPVEGPSKPTGTAVFTLPATSLYSALKTAQSIASDDPYDPLLSCVHLGADPDRAGQVRVSATDRYTCGVEYLSVTGSPFPILIPRKETARLLDLIRGLSGWQVEFTELADGLPKSEGWVRVRAVHPEDGGELSMTFQSDPFFNFPDLQKLIDQFSDKTDEPFHLNPQKVVAACTAMAERTATKPVKFTHRVKPGAGGDTRMSRLLLLEQGRLSVGIMSVLAGRPLPEPSTDPDECDC